MIGQQKYDFPVGEIWRKASDSIPLISYRWDGSHDRNACIAFVIIDGSCRDAEDIKELGLPVFVRGFQPSGTVKASPGRVNVPVTCGGVEVKPGDLIVGDCDGVVVVAQEHEDEVIEKACSKFDKEKEIVEQLKQGKTTLEIYGFDRLLKKLSW